MSCGYVWYCIDNSCNNCGISRPTNGLCARCLDLPYCGICKRHLPVHCFDGGPRKICQVYLQIVYHVTIMRILHTLQILLLFRYRYTLSRLCAIELRKKTHLQTTHSHCTKQRHSRNFVTCNPIRHIVRNAYQQPSAHHRGHRSRRFTAARVY